MTRERLPNRRGADFREFEFGGNVYLVSAGFDGENRLREVFIDGGKTGQDMTSVLEDASVIFSLLLQYGATPAGIAKSMGRLSSGVVAPADLNRSDGGAHHQPASIIGAVADLLVEMAADG